MFAKDIINRAGAGMSPLFLSLVVIFFVVESIYAAYRVLKLYNEYLKNKHKNK